jgi:hypothetical protein
MIGIVTGLFGLGKTWLENRRLKAKAKADQEVKLIGQAGTWEEIHATNSGHSWKDEYWTIVFSLPLIMCFVPGLVPFVDQGFEVLSKTPDWYRYTVGVLVGASVGLRQFSKFTAGKRAEVAP